jgi:drug/metabolite transporter (DMT)-like permease
VNLDLGRWPLLLGAGIAWGVAFYVYRQTGDPDDGRSLAFALTVIGSVLVGAFVYDLASSRGSTRNNKEDR